METLVKFVWNGSAKWTVRSIKEIHGRHRDVIRRMIDQILVECIHCILKRVNAFEICIMLLICSELKVEGTRLCQLQTCIVLGSWADKCPGHYSACIYNYKYHSCDVHCRLWKHLLHPPNRCMSQWGTRLALIQQPGWCVFVASTEFRSQWDKQIYDPENLYGRIHSHRNEFCNIIVCVCPQCLLKFCNMAFCKMSLVDWLIKLFLFARSQVLILAWVHSTMWFSWVHPCRWHLKEGCDSLPYTVQIIIW
jgi:hypothetical protein